MEWTSEEWQKGDSAQKKECVRAYVLYTAEAKGEDTSGMSEEDIKAAVDIVSGAGVIDSLFENSDGKTLKELTDSALESSDDKGE